MKRISLSLLTMMATIISATALTVVPVQTVNAADHDTQCMDNVQGKIAWDNAHNTTWQKENLQQLCAGTTKPEEPGKCFAAVNTEHAAGKISWGKGSDWEWRNIINLCAGTNDAEKTISCFKNGISSGADWRDAILICHRAAKQS
ncbi:MAG: hypothetical protein RIQ52_366 [Pseudomonadota bacterium]|jgi:hypothetical protein